MTVIGALVATYVRLSTTLENPSFTWQKLQTDVIDKLMPAFTAGLHINHVLAGPPVAGVLSRLIAITVVLGVVGKFCHLVNIRGCRC